MAGWIRLHRQIQEHWLWEGRFDKAHAWVDLLMLANRKDVKTRYKGEIITCKRGDVNRSIKFLAERWGWSRKAVKGFLDTLEKDGMVATKLTTNRTVITLVNWELYQSDTFQNDSEGSNEGYNEGISEGYNEGSNEGSTNKKDKKDKKDKNINNINNIYPSSFDEFWKHYPRKQDKGQSYKCYQARLNDGYTEEQLLTACINYAAECEKEKREKKYIKVGSTFLSVNEPFVDYLKGGANEQSESGTRSDTQSYAEREAEIDRYLESDEFRNADNDLPFM